jgi:hypothetical protein
MLFQKLALPTAIALVLGAGTACGLWTDRWRDSRDVELARARLPQVARNFGDWRGEDSPAKTARWAQAGIRAHLTRVYQNTRTGAVVSVLLVCGRPGPIVGHTPQTCLGNVGYETQSEPIRATLTVPGQRGRASFWWADFTKDQAAVSETQRVYWSWRGGLAPTGHWNADSAPRTAFVTYHTLFKLYVTRLVSSHDVIQNSEPCEDFLDQFLPELEKTLFTGS